MADILPGILAAGFGAFFLVVLALSLVELLGKIYGTFRCLVRDELTSEQRVIYLLLIWFIPLGWLVYFLLGAERTGELFSEIDLTG